MKNENEERKVFKPENENERASNFGPERLPLSPPFPYPSLSILFPHFPLSYLLLLLSIIIKIFLLLHSHPTLLIIHSIIYYIYLFIYLILGLYESPQGRSLSSILYKAFHCLYRLVFFHSQQNSIVSFTVLLDIYIHKKKT